MLSAQTQNEFGVWNIPGRKPVVMYGTALMAKLAEQASQARPQPIAGVLFGTSHDQETRVTHFRPVDCRISEENQSIFSAEGEEALRIWSSGAHEDPSLSGLEPVGWYRSRWESMIHLEPEDLAMWNRHFQLPSQVALVLRVQSDSPVRAGFFIRPQHGGPVRTDSSYRTFEICPLTPPEATVGVERLAEAVQAGGGALALRPPPAAATDELEPPSELFTPPAATSRPAYIWAAACSALVFLAAATLFLLLRQTATGPAQPVREVALRFKGPPDQLNMVWNPQSALIRQATAATVRVFDAESVTTELLSKADLASGTRSVANRRGMVEVNMILQPAGAKDGPVMVAAQYVGPAASEAAMSAVEAKGLSREVALLQTSVNARVKANQAFTNRIDWLRKALLRRGVAREALPKLAVPTREPAAPIAKALVEPTKPLQTPPSVEARQNPTVPPPDSLPPVAAAPVFGTDRAAARPTAPAPEPPAAYAGPSSGKFIWTGYLAAGATITIDGRRASGGSVNGSLPGVPVRLSVYPGEFSTSGLSVYSAAPRHQSGTVTEPRSAQNGWLNTRYVYDPGRARDAQIASGPTEAGAYKQIQIRGGDRPVSVVVIEWAVAR